MNCPGCGFENANASTYCERCGASLQVPEYALGQKEYKAPPPPPLNGHKKILIPPPPPPTEYGDEYSMPSQILAYEKIIAPPRIFSGILYFVGIVLAALGLMGTVTTFGTSSRITLLLGIAMIIVGIVVFIRIRRHLPHLRWWQRILWIVVLTGSAFIVLIIEVLISPNATLTNYFTGCVILLYGLVWAAIAVW